MKRDPYSLFGWLAMAAVPIAPAFYFGFAIATDVFNEVATTLSIMWVAVLLAIVVGIVAAIGLELVGILSGHLAVKFWHMGQPVTALIAGAVLLFYVVLGVSGLEGLLAKGVVMFLITPAVYLLVGLQRHVETITLQETASTTAKREFQFTEKAKDNELERELKRREQEARHQLQLAQLNGKLPAPVRQVDDNKQPTIEATGFTDWRSIPPATRLQFAGMTTEEIRDKNPQIAQRTARLWRTRAQKLAEKAVLNGSGA